MLNYKRLIVFLVVAGITLNGSLSNAHNKIECFNATLDDVTVFAVCQTNKGCCCSSLSNLGTFSIAAQTSESFDVPEDVNVTLLINDGSCNGRRHDFSVGKKDNHRLSILKNEIRRIGHKSCDWLNVMEKDDG